MTDEVANHTLELLRRIDEKLDRLSDQVRENRERLGHLEELYLSLSRRVDRIDDRLDRIEKRLDLHEVR
jgi:predicted  nucleic acid-binding Zn-ribbon protein